MLQKECCALSSACYQEAHMESRACSRVSLGEMSAWTMGARGLDKRGSFFKLIDTIVSEIGELKQEMVQTDVSLENGLEASKSHSMVRHKDDGYSEEKDMKTCPRDSGYDSLSSRLSILDRLLHTHPIWLQLSLSEEEAAQVLRSQPPGIFLVRKSTKMQKKVLSLRLPCEFGAPLKEFAIKESTYTFSLEGSGISFADLFRLIAFYCISRPSQGQAMSCHPRSHLSGEASGLKVEKHFQWGRPALITWRKKPRGFI